MAHRTARVGAAIREEITGLLARGRLKDPRIHELVTITGVEVTRDLSLARVYFSVPDGEEAVATTSEGLQAAAGFVQRHLGKHLRMRTVPRVRFEYDPSIAEGDRMSRLLASLVDSGSSGEEE